MCLAHSQYAGCNNNMGMEVSWREIKKLCDRMASLWQFIRGLCHFIKTALGEEHMQRLDDAGNSFFLIREPVPTKEMWDGVQDVHSEKLSLCIVLDHTSRKQHIPVLFRDMLEEIMEEIILTC